MFRVVLCRFLWCSFSASVQYRETITEHLSIMMCSLLLLFLEWFNVELKPTNWFEWKSIPLSTYLNEVMTGVWWPCATYTGYCVIKAICDCVTLIMLMRSAQSGYLLFFAGVHSAAWTVTIFYDPWLYCYSQHLICYTPYFLILTPLCTFRLLQMLLFTIIPAPWTPLIQFWRRARSMI
jgi:hypothetical protein